MNAVEFLQAVWPKTGLYCIARGPFEASHGGKFFKHKSFTSIPEAAAFATKMSLTENVYFAVHTLKGLVEQKKDDGSTYLRVKRDHTNMLETRCFHADVDCGPSDPKGPKKYPDKNTARDALVAFCTTTGLPMPLVINSGRGLHIYWLFEEPMDSATWRGWALRLKALMAYHGFLVDESCTADSARVLRVVGTFNRKDPTNPLKVRCLHRGEHTPNAILFAQLELACDVLPAEPERDEAGVHALPPPKPSELARVCPTFVKMVQEAPTAPGIVWMATNTLALHTTGGADLAHKLASAHPTYSREETQGKLQRLVDIKMGPPTCGALQKLYGPDSPCPSCPYFGMPKSSPIVFARRLPKDELPSEIPQPELPFARTKRGIEFIPPATEDRPKPAQVILGYDFYPTGLVDEQFTESKSTTWIAKLPHQGEVTLRLPIDAYNNEDRLVSMMANRGVIIDKRNAKLVGGYMSHYIKLLQAHQQERSQQENFGWNKEHDEWFMGNVVITAKGDRTPVLSPALSNLVAHLQPKGTLEGQIKALEFYNDPRYVRQQFYIGLALGTPLLYLAAQYGLIVNMTGPSGASKTTVLYAAAGLWGRPDKISMGAGEDDATALGRSGRVRMLNNIPVCVDELTLMPADAVKRLAMAITQPGDRVVQTKDGREKRIPDTNKATVMLGTSNNSMHALLAQHSAAGTAGSMRVCEVETPRLDVHTKAQGDAFIRQLHQHYGHLGPEFIRHFVKNKAAVEAEFVKVMATVDFRGKMGQDERFHSAAFTCAIVALRIAKRLGLLSFSPDTVAEWLLGPQLQAMRGVVRESYSEPIDVLHAYVDSVAGNLLVVEQQPEGMGSKGKMVWVVERKPQGALKGRLETTQDLLFLSLQDFRDYCDRRNLPYHTTVSKLIADKVLAKDRMALARHVPDYVKALAWVLRVDLAHELMAGKAPLEVGGKIVHIFPAKKG